MTQNQWQAFVSFRESFRTKCGEWANFAHVLTPLAVAASEKDTPPYPHETAVVYNRALDDITEQSEIRYIVVGDNPGKDEQLAKNNRYLVGQSGKLAQNFFAKNVELGTDFRRNVIILNKTPIHTAKTNHLRSLARADSKVAALIAESQKWMAEQTFQLHIALCDDMLVAGVPELWLVGYAELKKNGIFSLYRDTLSAAYESHPAWQYVMAFQHFSMNRFSIDLKSRQRENTTETIRASLAALGKHHRIEIFGR